MTSEGRRDPRLLREHRNDRRKHTPVQTAGVDISCNKTVTWSHIVLFSYNIAMSRRDEPDGETVCVHAVPLRLPYGKTADPRGRVSWVTGFQPLRSVALRLLRSIRHCFASNGMDVSNAIPNFARAGRQCAHRTTSAGESPTPRKIGCFGALQAKVSRTETRFPACHVRGRIQGSLRVPASFTPAPLRPRGAPSGARARIGVVAATGAASVPGLARRPHRQGR